MAPRTLAMFPRGSVLIERGHEVAGGEVRGVLGTLARVLEAEFDDGRWGLVCVGDDLEEELALRLAVDGT